MGIGFGSRLCWAAAINLVLLDSCLSWFPAASFAPGIGYPLRNQALGRVRDVASVAAKFPLKRTSTSIVSGARCSTVRDVATQEDLMNVVQFASQALPNRYRVLPPLGVPHPGGQEHSVVCAPSTKRSVHQVLINLPSCCAQARRNRHRHNVHVSSGLCVPGLRVRV